MTQAEATWHGFERHGLSADVNHDEGSRIDFNMSLFRHLGSEAMEGHRNVYDQRVKPDFVREHNREPETRHEIRKSMLKNPYFKYWSHLRVHVQEAFNYDNARTVEKQMDLLKERATPPARPMGSLDLDPEFKLPKYQTSWDMHWMSGGFHTEHSKDDVTAGAMYDIAGIYIITNGKLGPANDGAAYSVIGYMQERFPDFTPTRILDEGCTIGQNTLPFKEVWPDAEVTGIDIGAPVLRYAHGRAEDMGVAVNFSQQNAEHTNYEDESFDFIVSTMFLHETSKRAVHNIVKENYRLLKPGGMMLHVEQPPYHKHDDLFVEFQRDWDTHNNNEPFWGPMHEMNLVDVALGAGFSKNEILEEMAPLIQPTDDDKFAKGTGAWYVLVAFKE